MAAKEFWTEKVGFRVISKENNGQGIRWIEVAPTQEAETSIILHDQDFISNMSPDVNLGTPSLLFFTNEFDQLYSDLLNKNVTVVDIINMPSGRTFNFADGHYFAVMEQ